MAHQTFFKPPRQTAAERLKARRDRYGWRTAAKVNKFGDPTRAAEKASATAHAKTVKDATRRVVWARSDRCELLCGLTEQETAEVCFKATHEAHEVVARSLTRGRPPEERFSPENTARTCANCHELIQRHRIGLFFHDEQLRMQGDYDVIGEYGEILRQVRRRGELRPQ